MNTRLQMVVSDPAFMLLVAAAFAVLLILLSPAAEAGMLSACRVYSLSAGLLYGATLLLSAVEPGITAVDAFYLSCMTFTTIGYGDIVHPVTAAGRVLVSLLALGGVAFFAVTMELIGSLRHKTDGAVLGKLGLEGVWSMMTVTVLAGIALCQLLEDSEMPKSFLDGACAHIEIARASMISEARLSLPFAVADWSVITTTSVGFGDFHPSSDRGKLCVCAYALCSMQAAANVMELAKRQLVHFCTVPARPLQTKRD